MHTMKETLNTKSPALADNLLKGVETDLSAFGLNFTDFVTLRLEVKDKSVQVLINDHPALTTSFKSDAGKVIGFVYRFQGTGEVDYLHVVDEKGQRWCDGTFGD